MCWHLTQLLHTLSAPWTPQTNKELLRLFHQQFWPCSVKPRRAGLHFHHQFTILSLSQAKPGIDLVQSRSKLDTLRLHPTHDNPPFSPKRDCVVRLNSCLCRKTWDKAVLCLVYLQCSFSYLQMSIPLRGQGIPFMKIANWFPDKAWSWKINIHIDYGPRSHVYYAKTKWLAEAALSSHITTVPPKNQPKVQDLLQFHKVDKWKTPENSSLGTKFILFQLRTASPESKMCWRNCLSSNLQRL